MTADSSELIFDEVILPVLEANLPKSYDLPYGGVITDEEVIVAMRERLSPAWLEEQACRFWTGQAHISSAGWTASGP